MSKYLSAAFFIFLGFFILLLNLGIINLGVLIYLLNLWPLVLILIGLDLIIRNSKIKQLFSVFVFIGFFALFFLSIYFYYHQQLKFGPIKIKRTFFIQGQVPERTSLKKQYEYDLPLSTEQYKVKLRFGAGRLKVGPTSNSLIQVDAETRKSRQPQVKIKKGEQTEINIYPEGKIDQTLLSLQQQWELNFNDRFPAIFKINTGASDNDLDFSRIRLKELDFETGASKTKLKFGLREKFVQAKIKTGAAGMQILVPEGMGVELEYDGGMANLELPESFEKINESRYKTKGYQNSGNKLSLEFETGVSSTTIKFYHPETFLSYQ
jgi:hypothetical protein